MSEFRSSRRINRPAALALVAGLTLSLAACTEDAPEIHPATVASSPIEQPTPTVKRDGPLFIPYDFYSDGMNLLQGALQIDPKTDSNGKVTETANLNAAVTNPTKNTAYELDINNIACNKDSGTLTAQVSYANLPKKEIIWKQNDNVVVGEETPIPLEYPCDPDVPNRLDLTVPKNTAETLALWGMWQVGIK